MKKNVTNLPFGTSTGYWDLRYKLGGNSGAGSYGRLAEFKAQFINDFVQKHKINSVIEWGCGDGNQLSLAKYHQYCGIDTSSNAIEQCKKLFGQDQSKSFLATGEFYTSNITAKAELALSLDVIFHLIEDNVYQNYMVDLFDSSTKFVIIYSSNSSRLTDKATHVKHRIFTNWIRDNRPNYEQMLKQANPFSWDETNPSVTTFSDFYIYNRLSSKN